MSARSVYHERHGGAQPKRWVVDTGAPADRQSAWARQAQGWGTIPEVPHWPCVRPMSNPPEPPRAWPDATLAPSPDPRRGFLLCVCWTRPCRRPAAGWATAKVHCLQPGPPTGRGFLFGRNIAASCSARPVACQVIRISRRHGRSEEKSGG